MSSVACHRVNVVGIQPTPKQANKPSQGLAQDRGDKKKGDAKRRVTAASRWFERKHLALLDFESASVMTANPGLRQTPSRRGKGVSPHRDFLDPSKLPEHPRQKSWPVEDEKMLQCSSENAGGKTLPLILDSHSHILPIQSL